MRWSDYEVSANVSLLFGELPYPERFRAAADAGFTAVESWWPFAEPHPGDARLDELAGIVAEAGVRLTGLNFYAGDMPAGERGVACRPARAHELDVNAEAVLRVARATGCRGFNLLYGQLDPGADAASQRVAAVEAYRRAAQAVADVDGVVLVEPLAEGLNGAYPLHTHRDALDLMDDAGVERLALLLDPKISRLVELWKGGTKPLALAGFGLAAVTPHILYRVANEVYVSPRIERCIFLCIPNTESTAPIQDGKVPARLLFNFIQECSQFADRQLKRFGIEYL
jgi:hydroxypyruvate isomerase